MKEYYKITLKPTFSNLSLQYTETQIYIYDYLRVRFSADENHNFAQNMGMGNQRS